MYRQMARYYEEIFPLSSAQLEFVLSALEAARNREEAGDGVLRLLEVGCGTGDLAAALAEKGAEVDGIDLNPEMARRARKRHGEGGQERLRFYEMDMREISRRFEANSYDGLTCLGNTLVHLSGPEEIEGFIRSAATLLVSGGKLIIQILNYDYLLEKRPVSLPPIETESVRFERHYGYSADSGAPGGPPEITFTTRLQIKASGELYEDSVELYPLKRAELRGMLLQAGFEEPRFYGGFDGSPMEAESFPLIATAGLG